MLTVKQSYVPEILPLQARAKGRVTQKLYLKD
jgi:hypothetical protein